jgi:hypothetical protein
MAQGKKIPEKTWDKLLELLEENFGVIALACQVAGISRKSYYHKLLNDPLFARKTQVLFERVQVPIAEEMLRADVLERKAWAIRYTLDRASRKWHHRMSAEYIREFEDRLMYVEGELEKKIETLESKFPAGEKESDLWQDTPAF